MMDQLERHHTQVPNEPLVWAQESPITDHHHKRGVSWLDEGARGAKQLRNGGRRIEEGVTCCETSVGVEGGA